MADRTALLLEVALLGDTPQAGTEQLARHSDPLVRAAALRHPQCPEAVKKAHLRDTSTAVSRAVLSTTKDTSLLAADEFTAPEKAQGIAGNPLTDKDVLERLLRHPSLRVVREAMMNSSSPMSGVLAAAGRSAPHEVFAAGLSSYPVNGAEWVMHCHPQVGDVWAGGPSSPALRGVGSALGVTQSAAHTLAQRGRGSHHRAVVLNPYVEEDVAKKANVPPALRTRRARMMDVLSGRSLTEAVDDPSTHAALARIGSATLDKALADSPALGAEALEVMLSRVRVDEQLEGKALSVIVNRFGGRVAGRLSGRQGISVSRLAGAAFRAPLLAWRVECSWAWKEESFSSQAEARRLAEAVGATHQAWETFFALLPQWEKSEMALAEVVNRV